MAGAEVKIPDLPQNTSPPATGKLAVDIAGTSSHVDISDLLKNHASQLIIDFHRGTYASLALLIAAFPAPTAGSFALITNGVGVDPSLALWDSDNSPAAWKIATTTPAAHAASHASGGSDAVKLDDLAATDDNTDLDASVSKHGLLSKIFWARLNAITNTGSGVIITAAERVITLRRNHWVFDSATGELDPGTGEFRLNHALAASATFVYLSQTNENARDVETLMSSLGNGARLLFSQEDDILTWQAFLVTGAVTDNTGWYKIPVSYQAGGTPEFDAAADVTLDITPQGITTTEQASILSQGTDITTLLADVAPTMGAGLTASATVTWAVDAAVRHNVEFLQMDEAHTLAVPTGVVKGHVLDLFVRQGAAAVWTLAFNSSILIAEKLLDDEGQPPVISPSFGATDMLRFVVDESAVVHLVDHVKDFKSTTSITLDEVVALPNTIGMKHNFAGPTTNLQMWCNGEECQPMRYNTVDANHYGTVWLPSDTVANFQILDNTGTYRTFSSKTLQARRARPTPTTIWYVSPDVAAAAGKYTPQDPGNFSTAEAAATAKTEIRLYEGSKPYFLGDVSISVDDISIVAVDGETPTFTGFSPFEPAWTLDASSTYTADALFTGTDDTSTAAAFLTDSTANWETNSLIGLRLRNTTDASITRITANTATTITGVLVGGTGNNWDSGDSYSIEAHDPLMQQAFFWDGGNLQRLAWFNSKTTLQASTRGGWTTSDENGTDSTSVAAAFLTDTTSAWTVNEWVGYTVHNVTDGSRGTVTANTATTVTATLTNGTDNHWDSGNVYSLEGNVLHVKLPDSSDPNDWQIKIPRQFDDFMLLTGDRPWVEGITVEGYGISTANNARGLRLTASLDATVRGCTFRSIDAQGLYVTGTSDGLIVEECKFEDAADNIIFDDWKAGYYNSEVSTALYVVGSESVVIRNNIVRGLRDWPLFSTGTNRYVDVHDNIIFNSIDGGEFGGVHNQIRWWNNIMDGGRFLLVAATMNTGPLWFVNNNSRRLGYLSPAEVTAGGNPGGLNSDNEAVKFNGIAGNVGQMIIVNNTFNQDEINLDTNYAGGTDHCCWNNNVGPSSGIVNQAYGRNNIFTGRGRPFSDKVATGTYDWDWNHYYTTNTPAYPTLYEWHATTYATFALFQAGSTLDANGAESNPSISTVDGLPATAIAGTNIPGITGNPIFKSIGQVKGSIVRFP